MRYLEEDLKEFGIKLEGWRQAAQKAGRWFYSIRILRRVAMATPMAYHGAPTASPWCGIGVHGTPPGTPWHATGGTMANRAATATALHEMSWQPPRHLNVHGI